MNTFRLIVTALCLSGISVTAQFAPPAIQWQAGFGGAMRDGVFGFLETSDRGFVIGGFSASPPGGNKTSANYGQNDYWVIRLDDQGNELWERTYGGSGDERISKIWILPEGDILLAGYSASQTNQIKTAPCRGGYDYWLVKIDGQGNKLWDQTYGGTSDDYLEVITPCADGGILLGGLSSSRPGGTKTAAQKGGGSDYWLVRIDSAGKQLWDQSYSGVNGNNSLEVVQPASDGTFILAGWSASSPGLDKTAPFHGSLDWWLLRVDAQGKKIWDRSFGGSGYETVWGVRESTNGSFLVGGLSSSTNGDRTAACFGQNDFLILRIDDAGGIQWQKSYGGTDYDDCRAFVPTADGGGLFCGKSASPPGGNKTSPWYGSHDFWAVRVDANGDKIWETSMGGAGLDDPFWIQQTSDGGYLLGGWSDSGISGNKTRPNYGDRDIWLVKLEPEKQQLLPPTALLRNGGASAFDFQLSGLSNAYVAEYSTNLHDWVPFQTNEIPVLTGIIRFSDTQTNASVQKFYRTRKLRPYPWLFKKPLINANERKSE